MPGTLVFNSIAAVGRPGTVTITLPDIRLTGSVEQDAGPGQNNTVLLDFMGGALAESDGHGTSLWRLISANASSPAALQAFLTSLDVNSIASAFAGVS